MSIFIAKSKSNKTVSVVLTNSFDSACDYWYKKNIIFDHVNQLEGYSTGVTPIVSTERKMIMNASNTRAQECFVII